MGFIMSMTLVFIAFVVGVMGLIGYTECMRVGYPQSACLLVAGAWGVGVLVILALSVHAAYYNPTKDGGECECCKKLI